MTSKMKRAVKFLIGVIPAVAVIGIGLLYMSVELTVIKTQRFLPDQDHNLPLEAKGRIFYVNETEFSQFVFYKDLFLAMVAVLLMVAIITRIWKRYMTDHDPLKSRPIKDRQ